MIQTKCSIRGLVSAGAFAPAEIFNGCNAPVLRGIVCTKDLKSKETLGNLWLLEDILHPSCRDPNEAPALVIMNSGNFSFIFHGHCTGASLGSLQDGCKMSS